MAKQRPLICIIASILTIIIGIVLVIAGSIFTKDTSLLQSLWTQLFSLSIFSIVIGGLAILTACGLIYVVHRQFPALTLLFSGALIIIALLAAICGVILVVGHSNFEATSNKNTATLFLNYSDTDSVISSKVLVGKIQQTYHCCGVVSAGYWKYVFPDNKSTPDSCCIQMTNGCGVESFNDESQIYLNGCAERIYYSLRNKYPTLTGMNFTLTVLALIAAIFGITYERYIREQYQSM